MKHVSFTGTQLGLKARQIASLDRVLRAEFAGDDVTAFHHGDCIGADEQAHELAEAIGYRIIIHPPLKSDKRAFKAAAQYYPHKDYIARNHDIVDVGQVLIGCPAQMDEITRSGTWATVRYAGQQRKRIVLILPDGSQVYE